MVSQLTAEQITELKEAFALVDKDGDGIISTKELGTLMKSIGHTESGAQETFDIDNMDDSNTIDCQEFLSMIARQMRDTDTEEDLMEALKVFDTNGTGYINLAELRHAVTSLEDNITEEEMDEMIREANSDKNGQIKYEDFVKMILSK